MKFDLDEKIHDLFINLKWKTNKYLVQKIITFLQYYSGSEQFQKPGSFFPHLQSAPHLHPKSASALNKF